MKESANKQRRDVQFKEGAQVLVKLRPRHQSTATRSQYSKLAKRFYGPFRIVQRIGPVTYKLDLPESSRIHPVFHCSLLKPYTPSTTPPEVPLSLPASSEEHQPLISPLAILDTKWTQSEKDSELLVLVQWAGLLPEDTSWEPWAQLKADYNLEDKVILEAQGYVENRLTQQENAAREQQNAETTQQTARAQQENTETEKGEGPRLKREIRKPYYLKDFVRK